MTTMTATSAEAEDRLSPEPTRLWNAPFGVLNIAAYITWLAVVFEPSRRAFAAGMTDARALGLVALSAQLLFFIACNRLGRLQRHAALARGLVIGQALATLVAFWMLSPSGSIPVLLIIVAAQLVPLFEIRSAVAWMFAFNAALGAMMTVRWSFAEALPNLLAYAGFQVFAALTTTYARRAEEARDAIARINAELMATRRLLVASARSEERLRLSRELHDVAGHKLTALKLHLRMAETAAPDARATALTTCAQLADQLLVDVRGVVAMLRVDDGIDLAAALGALIPTLPRPRVVLDVAPGLRVPRLDPAQTLLRCAQEGLTNALRHADADNVRIRLAAQGDEIVLEIEDDGQAATMPSFGNGLRGMAERLAAVGGRMVIERIADGGLRLRVVLPFIDPT